MTRRLLTAALTLCVAGGVYMASAPAQASNMGFKLERDIDYKRTAAGSPLRNLYWIAYPLFNGLGDVANSSTYPNNPCVGDTGGPVAGDGIMNVDDAICDHFVARLTTPGSPAGTFSMTYFSRQDCLPQTRNMTWRINQYQVSGDGAATPYLITNDHGYQINLAAQAGTSPTNRVIIVGSHDPAFPGQDIFAAPIPPACTPSPGVFCCGRDASQRDLLVVPYHTMYRNAVELLCDLLGTSWLDDGFEEDGTTPAGTAGDGKPDSLDECDTSIFDGTNSIAVSMFFNDEITNGVKTCSVSKRINDINWAGCPASQDFVLVPGEAYLVNILPAHIGTTVFLSPHF